MNRLSHSALLVVVLLGSAFSVLAQTPTPTTTTQPNQESHVETDELFILNIKERRIQEENFEAATAVVIGDEDPKRLRVEAGVSARAQSIDVLLRNVTGSVRFRGSLRRILDLLNSHPR